MRRLLFSAVPILALAACNDPTEEFKNLVSQEISSWDELCLPVAYNHDFPSFPMVPEQFSDFVLADWAEGIQAADPAFKLDDGTLSGGVVAGMSSMFSTLAASEISSSESFDLPRLTSKDLFRGMYQQGLVDDAEVLDAATRRRKEAIGLTDQGTMTDFWNEDVSAVCLGSAVFNDVVRFTYGDNGANENAAELEFTWSLKSADWVDPNAFAHVPGMESPETATVFVVKSSDGWRISPERQAGNS